MPGDEAHSLIERAEEFPIPPENLDLLTATPEQLHHYGLPPRPSAKNEPQLFAVWRSFFVPRPTFVRAHLSPIHADQFRPLVRETPGGAAIFVNSATRYETSRNWCGAYIEANDDKVLVQVSGRWTVPRPSPPLGAEPDPQRRRGLRLLHLGRIGRTTAVCGFVAAADRNVASGNRGRERLDRD